MPVLPWSWRAATFRKTKPERDNVRDEYERSDRAVTRAITKRERLLGVGYVVALLLTSVGLMLAHHFFNSFMNEKSFQPELSELPTPLKDQNNVTFVGTTIAHGVRIGLSMAIGVTVVQLIWGSLRSQSSTMERIDALIKCNTSPFNTSAIHAASASFLVFITSLVSSCMALVVILTPGSLTVVTDFQRTRSCEVFTVPAAWDSPCNVLLFQTSWIDLNILVSNTFIPPLLLDRDAACGVGASTCFYDISFHGPAFDCVDISNQTDLSLHFPNSAMAPEDKPFLIWSAGPAEVMGYVGYEIFTQDVARASLRATRCAVYNATYHVRIVSSGGGHSTAVQVQNVSLLKPYFSDFDPNGFINPGDALIDTVFQNLVGWIFAGPTGVAGNDPKTPMQTSRLFGTTPTGNSTLNDDIIHYLTSYMQNITISLLSGNMYYCFSNDTETNLQRVGTTCNSTFVYDATRLVTTYSIALCAASLAVAVGCWLVSRDGKEEMLLFSQVVKISSNEALLRASGSLGATTLLRLERPTDDDKLGELLPVSDDRNDNSTSPSKAEKGATSKQDALFSTENSTFWDKCWKRLTAQRDKSAVLITLATVCIALHHTYYHYANGKTPNSRLSNSHWLTDQTVMSDVGITLAYLVQSLFGLTIAMSSTRCFWRTMRSKAITICEIDALASIQSRPFSLSTPRALFASPGVSFQAILMAAMSLISIFAPASIKISDSYKQSKGCSVATPRNLSALNVNTNARGQYMSPIQNALSLGSYLPPINPCKLSDTSTCSYKLDYIGPGFDCHDVTTLSNQTAYTTPILDGNTNLFHSFNASILPQNENLTMKLSVQTWDVDNSIYTRGPQQFVL